MSAVETALGQQVTSSLCGVFAGLLGVVSEKNDREKTCSDHVTRSASVARNNEAKGRGKATSTAAHSQKEFFKTDWNILSLEYFFDFSSSLMQTSLIFNYLNIFVTLSLF